MNKKHRKSSKKSKEIQVLLWTIINTMINLLRLIVDIFRIKH
jgi:hypothetical protein